MSPVDPSVKPIGAVSTTTVSDSRVAEPRTNRPAANNQTPGVDDGWDSATSTSWATDLAEPNEAARRQAWKEHDDRLQQHFEYERSKAQEQEQEGNTADPKDIDRLQENRITAPTDPRPAAASTQSKNNARTTRAAEITGVQRKQ